MCDHVKWASKYNHVTPQLRDLHWLPFPERITFRLAVLANRCQHGLAPSPRRVCWLPSETSINIDGSTARSTHETLESWWPSFPSYRFTRLEQSTTQCHFSALSVYFQKKTQIQTFYSTYFVLTVYMRTLVLFHMPLIYVSFLFKTPSCHTMFGGRRLNFLTAVMPKNMRLHVKV